MQRTTAPERRKALRALLARKQLLVVPGVTNAFVARQAEQAGFEALFVTGGGIANTLLGVPDVGLTTLTETVQLTRYIVAAVDVPVIADADTGYGNHLNVLRTVRELEDAGVAGLVLEDQVSPKRCGHFDRKRVLPAGEMVEKLVAASSARRDPGLVLVARTDALGAEGLDSTLDRARAYARAGADVIYVEAPRTVEEMAAIPPAVELPCLIDVVEGGITPLLPADELQAMGYRIALHANFALRVASLAVERALASLREAGTSIGLLDQLLGFEERQAVVGLPEWERFDRDVAAAARATGDEEGGPRPEVRPPA